MMTPPEVTSLDLLTWALWAGDRGLVEIIRVSVLTLGAIGGFGLLWWRTRSVHRQAVAALEQSKTAMLRHESQTQAEQARRITESFTKAIEQLGSDRLTTRLGAVYALERIARESKADHWPVMETLAAYVRERAPWPPRPTAEEAEGLPQENPKPATDIQAILTVFGRRRREHENNTSRLDLSSTNLRGAYLEGANLERANLMAAHLEGAILTRANLKRVKLMDAHLEAVILLEANLERGNLMNAHLEEAHINVANLNLAFLKDAYLVGADLAGADLERAILRGAHLESANFRDTNLTQEQFDQAISDKDTWLPLHIKRPETA
jgi:Pentapeptide repeats (8 copies)